MSLYNQLFDEDPNANTLLSILNLDRDAFGRFRDIHVNADGTYIQVLTRCGGFNRDMYAREIHNIHTHPNFVKDYDDEYDNTYSYIIFKVPERFLEYTKGISTGVDPLTLQELFEKEMKEMEDPNSEAAKRAKKIAKQIEEGLKNNPNGGFIGL